MENHQDLRLKEEIRIESLLAVHHLEYTDNFSFSDEVYAFWRLLYVERGEAAVSWGEHIHTLKSGDMIFSRPMELHCSSVRGCASTALVSIAFDCASPAMRFFEHRLVQTTSTERALITQIIREANASYATPLDNPEIHPMELRRDAPFAAQQFIRLHLELLLLLLIRRSGLSPFCTSHSHLAGGKQADYEILHQVIVYLEQHVHQRLSLNDVCQDNQISRSYLQKMFREQMGGGVMEYFGRLKIEAAKQAIREHSGSFTEIAHQLGYASIHYFSRHFKKITGMSPSEYAFAVGKGSEGLPVLSRPWGRRNPEPIRNKCQ